MTKKDKTVPFGKAGGFQEMLRAVLLTGITIGAAMPSGTADIVGNVTGSLVKQPPDVHVST